MVRVVPGPDEEDGDNWLYAAELSEDEGGGAKIHVIGWLVPTSPTDNNDRICAASMIYI